MATQTKTVEVIGNATGNTSGYAAKRTGATGTATSVTVAEVAGTGAYTVSVNWDDASAANEPLGDWLISVGSAVGSVGRSAVTFTTDVDSYTVQPCGTADAIVDEIEDRGITTVAVQSGVTSSTVMELVQGDTYNGTGKPLISFTVAVDYTDGWTATLTIRDEDDVLISTTTGTVASITSITFSMTAPTGLTMVGCPGSWKGKFDVQLSKSTNRVTITRGTVYVYEDQTRT